MHWTLASIFMFASSIVFYLSVKKLQVIGVDKRIYTLANYVFPSCIFFIFAIVQGISLWLAVWMIIAIFLARVGFNYVGTIAGYKGMEEAPNAGYSLVIQKSYAAYTLFASTVLYGSELPLHKVLLSIMILISAFAITITRGKKLSITNYRWAIYSLVAFFCFGAISLSSKYFANIGVGAIPQLFWSMFLTLCLTTGDIFRVKKRMSFTFGKQAIFFMIILGISVTSFYYFKLVAEIASPNIGYVGAINAGSNAFYTVIVALLFKDSLSWKKFLAVLVLTVGLVLLLFS